MVKHHFGCIQLRWFALAALALGATVIAGPGALGQAANPSGVVGKAPVARELTQKDLAAAGVAASGSPVSTSEAEKPVEEAPPPPRGPVDASGTVGATPQAVRAAPTASELEAAGVKVR